MVRFLTVCLATLFVSIGAMAQDFTVANFECDPTDLTAQQRNIKDENGNPCSLLRVLLVDRGAKFSGSYTGDVENLQNEYWLWMLDGAESISIRTSSSSILTIRFADYGTDKLKGKYVYVLTVLNNTSSERMENLVSFKVEPSEAKIFIDNEKYDVVSGYLTLVLPYGRHTYSAKAKNCVPQEGSFEVGKKQTLLNIHLANANASLSVSTPSSSAEIFLDDESVGHGDWKGDVAPGDHYVEVLDNSYTTGRQKITLKQQETKEVNLTPNIPMTGTLMISNVPSNATLYLDGERINIASTQTKNLLVGNHYVDIICDGMKSQTYSFDIKRDQAHNIRAILESGNGWQFDVRGVKFEMIFVEGGNFLMCYSGKVSPSTFSRYRNQVTVDSYYIGQYAVTQGLWTAIYGSPNEDIAKRLKKQEEEGYLLPRNRRVGEDKPLFCLSWRDINLLIENLNSLTGKTFRLPTEAEWEFAAKGGNESNGYEYSGASTWEESQRKPNELGIYGMTSCFEELCSDVYSKDLGEFPKFNPTGPSNNDTKGSLSLVTRGGEENTLFKRHSKKVNDNNINQYYELDVNVRLVLDSPHRRSEVNSSASGYQTSLASSNFDDEIYTHTSSYPEFPGGNKELNYYLIENVKYPARAKKNKIAGDVVVSFIVERDGSITNVQLEAPVEESLDEEAKHVIESMPSWTPGKDWEDNIVRVRRAISIGFGTKNQFSTPWFGLLNEIETYHWYLPVKGNEKKTNTPSLGRTNWGHGTSVRHNSQQRKGFRR